ncbi:unnamed protein product [Acanthoscelides obtectus]|uniref:EF-hand domain-containing protein n=1 Tax=Acanthoscelides obtectus TaxID=200917 RepID=A0A9P0KGS5_ACAOB|nr:unnamed protein product [Acanthoscelides obtectus]CAK1646969.1 Calcium uptake protein 3, mitochondrial [Acanthoscelides obtectus]
MSSTIRKLFGAFNWNHFQILFSNMRRTKPRLYAIRVIGGATALTFLCVGGLSRNFYLVPSVSAKKGKHATEMKLTATEKRFIKFASTEHDGQLYMTPQDFLESVIHREPRPRIHRKILSDMEMHHIKDYTQTVEMGSTRLFRDIHQHGIISYVEYLFLLSILYKAHTRFEIAFNAFDRDGNGVVDLNEFCIIEKIFSDTWKERKEKVKVKEIEDEDSGEIDENEALHKEHNVATTLKLHFFGQDGTSVLSFDSFKKFMRDLQTELLEVEFLEFSRGFEFISEIEFMRLILRYSFLDINEFDEYLDDLLERIQEPIGITFREFKDFCDFLNSLDDFTYAIDFYMPVRKGIHTFDFQRAVKVSTGIDLSTHLVQAVFAIFASKDGLLDFDDFMDIARDRQKRVFQTHNKTYGWEGFKACVREEMNKTKTNPRWKDKLKHHKK